MPRGKLSVPLLVTSLRFVQMVSLASYRKGNVSLNAEEDARAPCRPNLDDCSAAGTTDGPSFEVTLHVKVATIIIPTVGSVGRR